MAKKQAKTSLISGLVLVVLAAVAAVIAYKQIYLVGRLTTNLPEPELTAGLQKCMQTHLTPERLKKDLEAAQLDTQLNFNVGGLLSSVWEKLSDTVVETQITKNYLSEIKVLKIQDLMGENAEIQVTGSVDVVSKIPVVGDITNRKDYRTVLVKRAAEYHFNGLEVKKPESAQWDTWSCTQKL